MLWEAIIETINLALVLLFAIVMIAIVTRDGN